MSGAKEAQPLGLELAAPSQEEPHSWCLAGDFQEWNAESDFLNDAGQNGDRLAGDGIYSLNYEFARPGKYSWKIVACGNWNVAFPDEPAWVYVTQRAQVVTFTLDTNRYRDEALLPVRFAVNANDLEAGDFTAVSDFQGWDNRGPATTLEPAGKDRYRLVYRVSTPGTYTGYVVVTETWDGFGANGRSTHPAPLQFNTTKANEPVIFLLDKSTGRTGILYDIPLLSDWLAFRGGTYLLGLIVAIAAIGWAGRVWILQQPHLWLDAGCPHCQHSKNLRRIHRRNQDYLLNLLGLRARRYYCAQCHWQGVRLG